MIDGLSSSILLLCDGVFRSSSYEIASVMWLLVFGGWAHCFPAFLLGLLVIAQRANKANATANDFMVEGKYIATANNNDNNLLIIK